MFPKEAKEKTNGISQGEGRGAGHVQITGDTFSSLKGAKKGEALSTHTHTHPSVFWNGNTEMAFGKNYKAVESFRQALSLGA